MEVCVMKGGGLERLGVVRKNHVDACALGWRTCPKQQATPLRYTCLSPIPLEASFQIGTEENRTSSYGCLWSKVLAKKQKGTKRRILMKRRGGSRRGSNGIRRRVRTLKSLIPNVDSLGLDGLFRETANYILSLQTRVRVMQVMVKVLTGSDDEFIDQFYDHGVKGEPALLAY
ncbi:Transcription factor UPBEAT1, partial [Mucuna pruriens]